jgi:two-component system sensor histidine kinase KdpD
LVTIIGTLSSLDSGMHRLDGATLQKLVRQALRESEKLNRLVSNLLNMSRLESGAVQLQLEPVDLQDLVGATFEAMKDWIDREIRITVPEELPLVPADFVLVQQALMNLLDNALKYSPEGSPVDVEIQIEDPWVYVAVSDRGPGIDESELPNIFNKFYRIRGRSKPGGTGLGLAIVKGVIDAHSARIEVFQREEGGMVFRLGFPRIEIEREPAYAG